MAQEKEQSGPGRVLPAVLQCAFGVGERAVGGRVGHERRQTQGRPAREQPGGSGGSVRGGTCGGGAQKREFLDSADAQMNLHMSKVTYTKFQGAKQHLDAMYVRGTNIRMIHFPPKVDCAQRMKDQKRRRLEAKAASMKGALGPMNAPKPSGNPGDGAASGSGS
eukprot:CAMPEP_0177792154 /NCGR_PEP_ID=MMETSP0491_2-20121128/24370_1 /TAXON_ID=63592 /ORGANISM="Tetraselmis chuii, Strain PLY429" /LENGTH=163 /DNA_ID=CAMNT_0019314543 /DNA_START=27 /DNA_END=519 /DNA_ORIENTATION=-